MKRGLGHGQVCGDWVLQTGRRRWGARQGLWGEGLDGFRLRQPCFNEDAGVRKQALEEMGHALGPVRHSRPQAGGHRRRYMGFASRSSEMGRALGPVEGVRVQAEPVERAATQLGEAVVSGDAACLEGCQQSSCGS